MCSNITVRNCVFVLNGAKSGGAMTAQDVDGLTIVDTIFQSNEVSCPCAPSQPHLLLTGHLHSTSAAPKHEGSAT